MLGRHHKQQDISRVLTRVYLLQIFAPRNRAIESHTVQHTFGRIAALIVNIYFVSGGEYRYGADAVGKALLDMKRLPWTLRLVFRDTHTEFSRRAYGVHIHMSWPAIPDVDH